MNNRKPVALSVFQLDNYAAWNWDSDGVQWGSTILHGAAICYDPTTPVGARVRWLWAITEALARYEIATGSTRPVVVRLCPVKRSALKDFVADIAGNGPDDSTNAILSHLRKLDLRYRIEAVSRSELLTLRDIGDQQVRLGMVARAGQGLGVVAALAGV